MTAGWRRIAGAAWRMLRRLSGDDAYERYLAHRRRAHGDTAAPLARAEFYQRELERRWSGVNRCC